MEHANNGAYCFQSPPTNRNTHTDRNATLHSSFCYLVFYIFLVLPSHFYYRCSQLPSPITLSWFNVHSSLALYPPSAPYQESWGLDNARQLGRFLIISLNTSQTRFQFTPCHFIPHLHSLRIIFSAISLFSSPLLSLTMQNIKTSSRFWLSRSHLPPGWMSVLCFFLHFHMSSHPFCFLQLFGFIWNHDQWKEYIIHPLVCAAPSSRVLSRFPVASIFIPLFPFVGSFDSSVSVFLLSAPRLNLCYHG